MELTNNSSTSTDPLEQIVEQIFTDMLLAYGKKFGDMWAGSTLDALIAFWAKGLRGYTPREVKRGIEALETRPWPPTLPEFKVLCRPLVDPLKAYYEAVAGIQARAAGEFGIWTHPAIYWAAMPLSFDLGSQTYSQVRARWEAALDEQMSKGEWGEIPQPMLTLAGPDRAITKEAAAQALRSLKVEIKTPTSKIDHKRWAKRIQARAKRGDKTLSLLQIQFAAEALTAPDETTSHAKV